MNFPSFIEFLAIGAFLGLVVLVLGYTDLDKEDKEQKNKFKTFIVLLVITFIGLLFLV